MGWITLSLRRSTLQTSINDISYQLLHLNKIKRNLSNFSTVVADGRITPNEFESISSDLTGDAADFMGFSDQFAREMASQQASLYQNAYGSITQDQYMANPAIANQATLMFDENGNLNMEAMMAQFYEEALKEYTDNFIMPKLNEIEKEIERKQVELETELEAEQGELQAVKGQISNSINNSTIKLS